MQVQQIFVKNFRCFQNFTLDLSAPLILINGDNGAGKTSLLEALHYCCYLRSFRTHSSKELVTLDATNFFIKLILQEKEQETQTLQVGFDLHKKRIKLEQRVIQSYKELTDHYRVATLTEDDIQLIKGSPELRRTFLDQAIAMYKDEHLTQLRAYRKVLQQRNSLLQQPTVNKKNYQVWSEKLWQLTKEIQQERKILLELLQRETNTLLQDHVAQELSVTFSYKEKIKEMGNSFEGFSKKHKSLYQRETILRRSQFGAHLDDYAISFQGRASKLYASRGQQKFIILLIKIAQLHILTQKRGRSIFLLDDFMTDFDKQKVDVIMNMLNNLKTQLIFTSPCQSSYLNQKLLAMGANEKNLSV